MPLSKVITVRPARLGSVADNATTGAVEVLTLGSARAYREGQTTMIELLDAQRTRTEIELRKLQLMTAAKRAETRLRHATGELQ